MAQTVIMPSFGQGASEATIAVWHKKEDDAVSSGDKLFEARANGETRTVEAPTGGVLRMVLAREGETLPCLSTVAVIAPPEEKIDRLIAAADVDEGLEEIVPMSGIRKALAFHMLESRNISPTVTLVMPVDMTAIRAMKAGLAASGTKASYNDIVIKFTAKTLTEFPRLNCSIDGDNFIMKKYVNIGIVVAVDDGIMVPVIRDADRKPLADIAAESKELAQKARAGLLPMEAQEGGTFSISNVGMYGVEAFTCILKQPEVAILGVPSIVDTVVAVDGVPAVRPIIKMCLTFDHRAFDGATACQFLARLREYLEKPYLLGV